MYTPFGKVAKLCNCISSSFIKGMAACISNDFPYHLIATFPLGSSNKTLQNHSHLFGVCLVFQ